MKNCKDKQIRIYSSELISEPYYGNDDNSHDGCPGELDKEFHFFTEEQIKEEYYLNSFLFLNPDYDPDYEPSEDNRKYLVYGEDDFTTDPEEEVFDYKSWKDFQKAIRDQDDAYFCDDENFERSHVGDSRRIYEYHDGHNWQKIVLESDVDSTEYTREDELEKYSIEKVYSSKNGQGQGHREIYKVLNEEGAFFCYVELGVSYWQGELNNIAVWVSEKYVNEIAQL